MALSDAERLYVAIGRAVRSGPTWSRRCRPDIALRNKLVHNVWWESHGTFERVLFRPGRHEPRGRTALRVEELEDLDARLRAHYIELMRYAAWFTDRVSDSQAP